MEMEMENDIKQIFDLSVERRFYYSDNFKGNGCPECSETLIEDSCTILLHAESKTDKGEFITNKTGATFCKNCPVVVFNSADITVAAKIAVSAKEEVLYGILGIIDLNAIPKEKRHLGIGTDENPTPIVYFLPPLPAAPKPRPVSQNSVCACGSGKKYKRCCGK